MTTNNVDVLNINTNIRIHSEYKFSPIYQNLVDSILSHSDFNMFLHLMFSDSHYEIIDILPHDNSFHYMNVNEVFIFNNNQMQSLCSYIRFKPMHFGLPFQLKLLPYKLILFNSHVHKYADKYININDRKDHYRFLFRKNNQYYNLHYWRARNLCIFTSYTIDNNGNIYENKENIKQGDSSVQQFIANLAEQLPDLQEELTLCGSYICAIQL